MNLLSFFIFLVWE